MGTLVITEFSYFHHVGSKRIRGSKKCLAMFAIVELFDSTAECTASKRNGKS